MGQVRHLRQQIPVVPLVRHLMCDNQMRVGINHALNIVADMPAVLRTCCHGAGIGIGE